MIIQSTIWFPSNEFRRSKKFLAYITNFENILNNTKKIDVKSDFPQTF